MSVTAATKYFRSYGVKCDETLVEEWLNSTALKNRPRNGFCEDDLYDFNEWCRWKDTAYEEGIDDQTKITRLLEEINELKTEITNLKKEKEVLQNQLGINLF